MLSQLLQSSTRRPALIVPATYSLAHFRLAPSLLPSLSLFLPFRSFNIMARARSAGTAAAFYSVQVSVNCRLGSTDGSATLLALTPSACLTTVNRTERGSQSIAWIAHQLVLHCFKSPIKVLVQRPAGARNVLESPGHCMQMANDWPSWPFLTDQRERKALNQVKNPCSCPSGGANDCLNGG